MADSGKKMTDNIEKILDRYQAKKQPGKVDVWACIPGAKIRAVRKSGLDKIRKSAATIGWVDNPIIVSKKKMTVDGKTKVRYLVIDGMHRVTVCRELARKGNETRNKVIPPVMHGLSVTHID